MTIRSTDSRPRRSIIRAGFIVSLLMLGYLLWQLANLPSARLVDDFIEYWSAGRLNLLGKNPYDPDLMLALQRSVEQERENAVMMWNPPLALGIAMPFGALSYPVSRVIWLMLNIIVVIYCSIRLWHLYGGPSQYAWLPLVGTAFFMPALFALRMGQISPLILLGIVGFMECEKRGHPVLAGVFIALTALKPQLLYLLWPTLIFWVIQRQYWTFLLGVMLFSIASMSAAWWFNPSVLNQYVHAVISYPPDYGTPTLGTFLRLVFGIEHLWLRFIPPIIGLAWLLFDRFTHRRDWEWTGIMPRLLLISVVTTFYGWEYDQIVLLVVIVQVMVWLARAQGSRLPIIAAIVYLIINLLALIQNISHSNSIWYVWLAPSFLFSYLYVRHQLAPTKNAF